LMIQVIGSDLGQDVSDKHRKPQLLIGHHER
jgi:hypothetical protein